jgi:ankyrin repeat protein
LTVDFDLLSARRADAGGSREEIVMSDPASRLPVRPSLEQLRKQAKDLLRDYRAGDADAMRRMHGVIPQHGDRAGLALADAQFALAREYGFQNWAALVQHVERVNPSHATPPHRPPIRPFEWRPGAVVTLPDGGSAPADTVYSMFLAAHAGDLDHVKALVDRHPGLARHEYNYTPPIHFAVREGHSALVRLLVERGAIDPSYQSYPFGDSLLTFADDRGHSAVSAVLREHLAKRFALKEGLTAILEAARQGDLSRVEEELRRDPSLARGSNDLGMTPLHAAANNGHLAVVRALLDAGAPVNAIMGDGYRPIHNALMPKGRVRPAPEASRAVADALIAHGAEYTIVVALLRGDRQFAMDALARDSSLANFEDTCHRRPISVAAHRDDLEMVRLLLKHGADPNLPEEGAPRGNALWPAVYHRRREMARVLVEHGADPNAMVESSGTPMMHALKDPELYALLRAHGGIDEPDEREQLQRKIGDDLKAAELLLKQNPSLITNQASFWNEGILAGPARDGNHAVLELLIRYGATVPKVSKWGRFYYFKHTDTAALLLKHGMDPDHMNWHYTTLLHHVASDGDIPKAKLLLDYGATIDAIDEEYRSTPLGMAARWGRKEMVELLLERGADPTLAGDPWATPVEWARKKGHRELLDVMSAWTQT